MGSSAVYTVLPLLTRATTTQHCVRHSIYIHALTTSIVLEATSYKQLTGDGNVQCEAKLGYDLQDHTSNSVLLKARPTASFKGCSLTGRKAHLRPVFPWS